MAKKTKWAKIEGRRHRVPDPLVLKKEVRAHMRKERLGKKGRINQRRLEASLAHQLGVYGWTLDPRKKEKRTTNIGRALTALGFDTKRHGDYKTVAESWRRVFPRRFVQRLYSGEERLSTGVKSRMFAAGEGDAYRTIKGRRPDKRLSSVKGLLDSLYPDLKMRHGRSLSEVLYDPPITPEEITDQVTEWFYAGKNLAYQHHGMRSLGERGRRIANAIKRNPLPGDLRTRRRTFTQKVCAYLADTVPGVTPDDIAPNKEALRRGGLIGERELLFLLAIVSHVDPSLRKMGAAFRRYFPPPIRNVLTPGKREDVRIKNGRRPLEADGRLVCGDGEVVLEAKTYGTCHSGKLAEIAENYAGIESWLDGTPIGGRVALISLANGLTENGRAGLETLQEAGWRVMQREEFRNFYERALELLAEKEPEFFTSSAAVPIGLESLLEIDTLTNEQSYWFLRGGNGFLRWWVANMLSKNTECLLTGDRFEERATYPLERIVPFSTLQDRYEKKLPVAAKGCLYLDLETVGFRNTGSSIVVGGVGYLKGGRMIVHQWTANNPLEEKAVVEALERHAAQAKEIITFNGDTFDLGLLGERARTHLVRVLRQSNVRHLDLMHGWKEYARGNEFPTHTLQCYERTRLNSKRKRDLPGKDVPKMYANFALGDDDEGHMGRILEHNALDVATLAFLHADRAVPKRYTKRSA